MRFFDVALLVCMAGEKFITPFNVAWDTLKRIEQMGHVGEQDNEQEKPWQL